MTRLLMVCAVVSFAWVVSGCGESTAPAPEKLDPPTNVRGLSVNGSAVGLSWDAPKSIDSTYRGFVVSYGSTVHEVPATTRSLVLAGLPQGPTQFSITSVGVDSSASTAVPFTWAPADRFEAGIVLYEQDVNFLSRDCALNIGGTNTDPDAVPLVFGQQAPVDLYLYGAAGQPLRLLGGQRFSSGWGPTLFSTVTSSSTDLNFSLAEFPTEFTTGEIPVQDNTIYYLRAVGDDGATHFVRLHVRVIDGVNYPSRSIEVRLSLQRVPNLQYASCAVVRPSLHLSMPTDEGV
jgi:hypothetical protein